MNRFDFMAQLERILMDLPESDRQDAIAYYNDYFDEAGPENEAKVIQELGSPGKVAAIIKADLKDGENQFGEFTEKGFQDDRFHEEFNAPTTKGRFKIPITLIIVLLVFASPILLGIGGGLFGLVAGVLGLLLGFVVLTSVGAGAMALGGILMVAVGIVQLFITPMFGTLLLGLGLIFLAIGILGIALFVLVVFKVIPKVFRWFVDVVQGFINRRKGGEKNEKVF